MKKNIQLFFTMLKVGLFTFGGGYAMISLLENQFVTKKKWLENDEFSDMIAVAESTPGPLAINSATYIGYRVSGVLGAILSTVAVCIPSFVIIYVISLFFEEFKSLELVSYAFKGIQVCIVYLISSTGIKLIIQLKKSLLNYVILALTIGCMTAFSLFSINFSAVFYILISGGAGLIYFLISLAKERKQRKDGENENDLS